MRLGVSAALIGDKLVTGDLEIEDGKVTQFGIGRGTGGSLAIPGFVDIHFHGRDGIDFTEAGAYEFVRVAQSVTSTGTTAFQPTLVSRPLEKMIAAINRHPGKIQGGARVLGFHLEGPFLSPEHCGAHRKSDLIEPTEDAVTSLLESGNVTQMTLAPELDGAIAAIERLVEHGIVVSLGHSAADAPSTRAAIDAGATAYTHVFNAMAPLDHHKSGILAVALSDSKSYLSGIFDGVHLTPEAAKILIRVAGDRLVAITDGTAAIGKAGDVKVGSRRVEVVDGAPRLKDGTMAGSVLTMDAAFRSLLDLGMTIAEASRATSAVPAAISGIEDGGTLIPGSVADIVVLNERFQVVRTLVGGVEVHSG